MSTVGLDGARGGLLELKEEPGAGVQQDCAAVPFVAFDKRDVERSIPDRFEQQVAIHGERLAVKSGDQAMTYGALNKTANSLARTILECCGAGSETIALLLEQGPNAIAANLAVLKAGKIDVPLDPANPPARIGFMLRDSKACLVIADNRTIALARDIGGTARWINIDERNSGGSDENLRLPMSPDAIARVIYTSGSTGEPKGVALSHRRILHEVMTNVNGCRVHSGDRIALLASPITSQATVITYTALLTGAGLCLFNLRREGMDGLADWLVREEITVYISVRAIFRRFATGLKREQKFPCLRFIGLGGDPVRRDDVELYKRLFPSDTVLKLFLSSTETGNLCQYLVDRETSFLGDVVPAGYASDGMEISLLGDQGEKVGVGEVGEIVVRSRYLASGYWGRPDLTSAKFLSDPEGREKRVYLTGDLGRQSPDGCIEHLGRKDFRVKVRGYGVEPGEIESALLEDPRVRETVVTAMEEADGDAHLVAYIVPMRRSGELVGDLRRFLRGRLPEHMVPADFVLLDDLPLTPMGKVDRQALPRPDRIGDEVEEGFVAATTPVEKMLADIWCGILKLPRVGMHDRLFDVGGHSLSATQIVSRVRDLFQTEVPLDVLLENPTVPELAAAISQLQADGSIGETGSDSSALPQYFSPEETGCPFGRHAGKSKVESDTET